ncbi:MAG: hypothetical protein R3F55_11170 [Alphaproteobacteria bacterium]
MSAVRTAGGRCRAALAAAMLSAALPAGGCGFKPIYGDLPGSVPTEQLAAVEIGLIADRSGQLLRNQLLHRMHPFGAAADTLYLLDVDLSESAIGIAVQRDETATRTNLTITAALALTDLTTGEIVLVDTIRSYSSYDTLTAEYATLSAERDARDRALVELGDRIATRVGLFLQRPG